MVEIKMNNQNVKSLEEDEQVLGNPKLVPVFGKIMKEYFESQEIECSSELNEKLMEMARAHKRKLQAEGKLKESFLSKIYNKLVSLFKKTLN